MQHPVSRSNGFAKSSVAFLAALVLLVLTAHVAEAAKKRVVVLGFSGPQASGAEATVGTVVASKNTLVSAAQYTKSQQRLRLKAPTNANVARIAADLQVDAIVAGMVQRKGAHWALTLIVREGLSGGAIATLNVPLRSPRIDVKAKQDITAQLLPAIAKTSSISGGGAVASTGRTRHKKVVAPPPEDDTSAGGDDSSGDTSTDEEPAPPPKKKHKKVVEEDSSSDEEPAPPPKKHKKKVDTEDENPLATSDDSSSGDSSSGDGEKKVASNDGDDSSDSEGDSAVVHKKKKHADDDAGAMTMIGSKYARTSGADLAAGMSFEGRNLSFNYSSSLMSGQQPNAYKGAVVPGLFVNAELYPLAFGKPQSVGAGFGIAVDVDRIITLKSKLGSQEFATTQTAYGVGLRFRLPLGKKPTLPTIKLAAGYRHLDFTIDHGMTDIGLPNVNYSMIDLGGGIRLPLGTTKLAIEGLFKYLDILSAGEFTSNTGYGGGSAAGIEVVAGIEIKPTDRLTLRAGFQYTRVAYSFSQVNALTDRDGDGVKDVGGALDTYTGGYATVGWLF
jgi:hypothetical protein